MAFTLPASAGFSAVAGFAAAGFAASAFAGPAAAAPPFASVEEAVDASVDFAAGAAGSAGSAVRPPERMAAPIPISRVAVRLPHFGHSRSGSALIDWKRSQRCRHFGFVHSYS